MLNLKWWKWTSGLVQEIKRGWKVFFFALQWRGLVTGGSGQKRKSRRTPDSLPLPATYVRRAYVNQTSRAPPVSPCETRGSVGASAGFACSLDAMQVSALSSRSARPVQLSSRQQRQPCRRAQQVRPAAALEIDEDTITLTVAAVAGLGFGIGIPVLFSRAEARDKERIEEIRELNRATLKATGETLSEARLLRWTDFRGLPQLCADCHSAGCRDDALIRFVSESMLFVTCPEYYLKR